MSLTPGTKLGPYEIATPLGAGGMGEVYRARDTRLGRDVAIKILPEQLSKDPVRKQRFEREAKTISSLNHPHICVLHDIGSQDGLDYLVMECVEGETLAKRLEKGALPLEQVLKYGAQIADALDKAHRSGVVHRDLKPGNIMLTQTGAKLLDFGLAKPVSSAASVAALSAAVTQSSPMTEQGAIVGTFQYMSPEQVEGKELDGRSDIFALGAVLYEMATARRAFEGKTPASAIAAVLERDPPPISAIQRMSPPALDQLVQTCLAKDPDQRFQSVHDVKLQLNWIAQANAFPVFTRRKARDNLVWILAAASTILCLALAWSIYIRPRVFEANPVFGFIPPPPGTHFVTFGFGSGPVVVSPDESQLAFSAIDQDGVLKLWVRSLKSHEASAVPGTEDGAAPFWGPDGRSLGFFANGKLKTANLSNGSIQVLSDSASFSAGSWSPDGTILFSGGGYLYGRLWRIPASGGKATPLALKATDLSESHPSFLPDGKHFLAVVTGKDLRNRVELASLTSSETKVVAEDAEGPICAAESLLFVRNGKIFGQPFNPASGKLSGSSSPLAEGAAFSVAGSSVLAFHASSPEARLAWLDLYSNQQVIAGTPAWYSSPRISPDGKQILAMVGDPQSAEYENFDLWSLPANGGVSTRLTFEGGPKGLSAWSPDGKYVAYPNVPSGQAATIFRKAADGSGTEETLLKLAPDIRILDGLDVADWSPDGRYLSYTVFNVKELHSATWVLPLFGNRTPFQVAPVRGNQYDGKFSPDGHWFAYLSDETGRLEVYVVPFPGPGGKYQISHTGVVTNPAWSKKNELFFVSTGNRLMKAELTLTAQSLHVDALRTLFPVDLLDRPMPLFDVSSDGKRILIVTPARPESNFISLLLNWPALLKK